MVEKDGIEIVGSNAGYEEVPADVLDANVGKEVDLTSSDGTVIGRAMLVKEGGGYSLQARINDAGAELLGFEPNYLSIGFTMQTGGEDPVPPVVTVVDDSEDLRYRPFRVVS